MNEKELAAAKHLTRTCIGEGIEPKGILLVTPFGAQHGALDRAVSHDDRLASIEAATIDRSLDGEKSIVAPSSTTTGEMGFMTNKTQLLVA